MSNIKMLAAGGPGPKGTPVSARSMSASVFGISSTLNADITDMVLQITADGPSDSFLVQWQIDTECTAGGAGILAAQITVDGVAQVNPTGGRFGQPVTGQRQIVPGMNVITGLTAGTHTVQIQARTTNVAVTFGIYIGNSFLTVQRISAS